jgi:hypothetical protein
MRFQRFIYVAVVACACIGLSTVALARKRPPPAKPEDIVGVWVGWADELHYYRLELASGGTGLCGFIEIPRQEARLYQVSRWVLDGYDIDITLKPIDQEAWPTTMRGTAISSTLQLQVGDGRKNGWRAKPILKREGFIESVMESAKKRMNAYPKPEDKK